MTSCPLRASPIAVPSPRPEPAPVMRIFRPMASSFKCKRSDAERSGWQRSRAGGRNNEVLLDLASRDADRSQQIAVRRPQWNSAREGDKSAVRMFEAMRLGVGLAYVPYRLRFSLEQDRSPGLSERDIGGSEPGSVHSRKGLHVTRRVEDRDAHGDPDGLRFRLWRRRSMCRLVRK